MSNFFLLVVLTYIIYWFIKHKNSNTPLSESISTGFKSLIMSRIFIVLLIMIIGAMIGGYKGITETPSSGTGDASPVIIGFMTALTGGFVGLIIGGIIAIVITITKSRRKGKRSS